MSGRLEPLGLEPETREIWNGLALEAGNLFATWEWMSVWWRHFGDPRRLLASAWRADEGGVTAIVPLYVWRRRWPRVLRFVGHGPGDQLGPVSAPDRVGDAAEALAVALERERWDVVLAEQLPGPADWGRRLAARRLTTEGSPVLRLADRSWDDLMASFSSSLRREIRSDARKLEQAAGVRYRLADDPATLDRDLDALFALHRARWGGRRSAFAAAEAFHRDFARVALESGWLRLWLLEADGAPVAAWYGFRFAGAELAYQTGRDPAWRRPSLGLLLQVHALRAALEEGMDEFRFLRGDEPHKYRFAREDPKLETVAVTRPPIGDAALRAAIALRSARRAVRRARSLAAHAAPRRLTARASTRRS